MGTFSVRFPFNCILEKVNLAHDSVFKNVADLANTCACACMRVCVCSLYSRVLRDSISHFLVGPSIHLRSSQLFQGHLKHFCLSACSSVCLTFSESSEARDVDQINDLVLIDTHMFQQAILFLSTKKMDGKIFDEGYHILTE